MSGGDCLANARAEIAARVGGGRLLSEVCEWTLTEPDDRDDGIERHADIVIPVALPVSCRPPNKHADVPSFAALLLKCIEERFDGDAPAVYRRAGVARQNYHKIVSGDSVPVTKRTAIRFCFALKLTLEEAERLLNAAGYVLSMAIAEDVVVAACLSCEPPVTELKDLDSLLREHGVDYAYVK